MLLDHCTAESYFYLEDMERILSEYGVLDDEIYRQEMQHNLYLVQNPEKRIGMVLYENIKQGGVCTVPSGKGKTV